MRMLKQTLRLLTLTPCFCATAAEFASGGGLSASPRFEVISSINSIATFAVGSSPSFTDRRGYIGLLNESPMARPDQVTVQPGRPLKVLATELLRNDADAEQNAIQLIDF